MTAQNTQADKSEEKDAEKAADQHNTEANRGQKDVETTEQARDRQVPSEPEKFETDEKKAEDDFDADAFDGGIDGGLGTVAEKNTAGEEYEVPWKYLTAEDLEEHTAVRTSDSDDPARSWTNQETVGDDDDAVPVALVPVQQTPGQTFRVSELPSVVEMEKAGINAAQFLAGLPVRPDVDGEAPRKGIPA